MLNKRLLTALLAVAITPLFSSSLLASETAETKELQQEHISIITKRHESIYQITLEYYSKVPRLKFGSYGNDPFRLLSFSAYGFKNIVPRFTTSGFSARGSLGYEESHGEDECITFQTLNLPEDVQKALINQLTSLCRDPFLNTPCRTFSVTTADSTAQRNFLEHATSATEPELSKLVQALKFRITEQHPQPKIDQVSLKQ